MNKRHYPKIRLTNIGFGRWLLPGCKDLHLEGAAQGVPVWKK